MTSAKEPQPDRFYTRDHEWAKPVTPEVIIGISSFAVDQLGDITLVDFNVAPGDVIVPQQVFGTVESVKTLSDLLAPVGGRVTRVNHELVDHPEWVNEDCWEKAWMIAVEAESNPAPSSDLLDLPAYLHFLEESDH